MRVCACVCVCVILTAVIFSDSRMSALCDSVSLSETGFALYLTNQDYPSGIRATETSCSCSVETASCSSKINVYFVHFQLVDVGGSCTGNQKIEIDDKGTVHTFTCNNNIGYSIIQRLTSRSNYLKIALDNQSGTRDGHFWIGFEGMLYFIFCSTLRQQVYGIYTLCFCHNI